jgi:predicted amidophosphoribosyltransferase
MASHYNHLTCPNCNKDWSADEIDYQVCATCNFPGHNSEAKEPDGEDFRGSEAQNFESDRMHYYQTHLK